MTTGEKEPSAGLRDNIFTSEEASVKRWKKSLIWDGHCLGVHCGTWVRHEEGCEVSSFVVCLCCVCAPEIEEWGRDPSVRWGPRCTPMGSSGVSGNGRASKQLIGISSLFWGTWGKLLQVHCIL